MISTHELLLNDLVSAVVNKEKQMALISIAFSPEVSPDSLCLGNWVLDQDIKLYNLTASDLRGKIC